MKQNLYKNELSQIWGKIVAYDNNGEEIKLLLDNIKIDKDSKILSLASGLAVFEGFIAKNIAESGKIACIDISDEMNKRAKAIAKKLKIKNKEVHKDYYENKNIVDDIKYTRKVWKKCILDGTINSIYKGFDIRRVLR